MTDNNSKGSNAVKAHKVRDVLGRLRNIRATSESAVPKKSWLARLRERLGIGKEKKETPES